MIKKDIRPPQLRRVRMDPKGLRLIARFATPALIKGLCGRPEDVASFHRLAKTGDDLGVGERLGYLKTLSAYLSVLLRVGIQELEEQAQAYWIGSDSLCSADLDHLRALCEELGPESVLATQLLAQPPGFFWPHHNYHVLLTAKRGGVVRWEDTNDCMVRRASVEGFRSEGIELEVNRLVWLKGELRDGAEEMVIPREMNLAGDLAIDDVVALHQGWIAMKLDEGEEDSLLYWTRELVERFDEL